MPLIYKTVAQSWQSAISLPMVRVTQAPGLKTSGVGPDRQITTAPGAESQTFRGAWFQVWVPPGFEVVPSLQSPSFVGRYDSAFFRSHDGEVEFYVYSPQWSGEPTDIAVNDATERKVTTKSATSKVSVVTWFTVEARDGSYVRTYQDTRSIDGSTRSVVGLKYATNPGREAYKTDYSRFKGSLRQFAD